MEVGDEISKRNEESVLVRARERERERERESYFIGLERKVLSSIQMQKVMVIAGRANFNHK